MSFTKLLSQRNQASSQKGAGKPPSPSAAGSCCSVARAETLRRRPWRRWGACAGSGVLFVLLPKCPACLAVYLTVWLSAGTAMAFAARLRTVLGSVFALSATLLLISAGSLIRRD